MDNDHYCLVVERKHGDIVPINLSLINSSYSNLPSILNIDNFTKNYTEEELFNKIKESNLIFENFYNGKILILKNKKIKLPLMDKTCFDDDFIINFIYYNINDKDMMNKLIQKYNNLIGTINIKKNISLKLNIQNVNKKAVIKQLI